MLLLRSGVVPRRSRNAANPTTAEVPAAATVNAAQQVVTDLIEIAEIERTGLVVVVETEIGTEMVVIETGITGVVVVEGGIMIGIGGTEAVMIEEGVTGDTDSACKPAFEPNLAADWHLS